MATPTLAFGTAVAIQNASTGLSVGVPAHTAGDRLLILAALHSETEANLTTPTDAGAWSKKAYAFDSGGAISVYIYELVAPSTEASGITVAVTGSVAVGLVAVGVVASPCTYDVAPLSTHSRTTVTDLPALTTLTNNVRGIYVGGVNIATSGGTAVTGLTEHVDLSSGGSSSVRALLYAGSADYATAGTQAVPDITTIGSTANNVWLYFGLKESIATTKAPPFARRPWYTWTRRTG
jgi:hypothetical protein